MGSSGYRRATGLVAAALVAGAVTAGVALAAFGDLSFQGCIEDRDDGVAAGECAASTPALNGVRAVVEYGGSDGGSVFAASSLDNAVVNFNRDAASGALTPRYCLKDGARAGECSTRNTVGLEGANSVFVPSDGRSLYATAGGDSSVWAIRARITRFGSFLFPVGCIEDDEAARDCERDGEIRDGPMTVTSTEGLEGASAVDARWDSLYVAAQSDDAIARFHRNPYDSAITPQGCVEDPPRAECGETARGLDGARSVAISRRGKSVYVASSGDDAIVHFPSDQKTGKLFKGRCIEDEPASGECAAAAPGLNGAHAVAVSEDEQSVYAVSAEDDAIVHFDRNPGTGNLTFRGCIKDSAPGECGSSAEGMDSPRSLAISYDGRSVYVASNFDSAIAIFSRDTTTGELTYQGCVEREVNEECKTAAAGIGRASSVAVSLNGASVYVAGFDDDAVLTFARDETSGRLTPAG
jgi:DNA-binding beta-propeller fold protein YncE